MTFTRLQTADPDLVEQLRAAPADAQRRVAFAVAETAAERTGIQQPLIARALDHLRDARSAPDLRSELAQLVDELDEHAWELQAQAERGTKAKDEYLKAFATARAAAAVQAALDDDPATAALEATYEAQAATQDINPVRAAAQQALG